MKTTDILLSPFEDKIKVVICPNYCKDNVDVKNNWGIENYERLINLLPDDFKTFLIDDSDGIGVCNHIKHLAPNTLNLAGLLTFEESMAIINLADIVVSNNSYFAHIAAGLDKHLMVFFNEKFIERSRPVGAKTVILKASAPDHKCQPTTIYNGCFCIGSIPPESVYNAMVKHILPEIDKEKKVQPIGV
jgi:ADP-heptose:LPS heptosyltransferase